MRPAGARERGFTLIEIVVVTTVIAIVVAAIAVRFDFDTSDERMHEQMRRFDVLFHLAWEQAQIEGRSVGLQVEQDAFTFFTYDPLQRQWFEMEDDEFFRRRELPDGMTFDLRMEDKDIELPTSEDAEDEVAPQVLLLSSGEATPFTLFLEADNSDIAYELIVGPLGESEIVEHDRGF